MTDEQEERILRLIPPIDARYFRLYWMDGDGYAFPSELSAEGMVSDIELAPTHTDEECEVNRELIREMKARIKELEELAPKHTEESLRITIGLIGNKLEFAGKVRDRGRIEGVLQGLLYVVGDLVEWELPGFPWLTEEREKK